MDWHVEVIRFEGICHFTKSSQGIVPGGLFKAKCFLWLTAFLQVKEKFVFYMTLQNTNYIWTIAKLDN